PAADATLRSHISRLRSVLGASRLPSQPPGYLLVLARDEVDAARFEQFLAQGRAALAEGRAAEAASVLRSALALWRGSALAHVAYESFAHPEIPRPPHFPLAAPPDSI